MQNIAARVARIIRLNRTDSTSRVAWNLAMRGEPDGSCVVAAMQSEGRGRLGRRWNSAPGTGLYFSSIHRPVLDNSHYPRLSLAVGVGVCQGLERLGLKPGLKWPNDILFAGKKACGILMEAGVDDHGQPFAVAGVGVNVLTPRSSFPPELSDRATSLLLATGRHIFIENLLDILLESIAGQTALLEKGGFTAIVDEWRRRDATCGRRMSWLTPAGAVVTGTALGLDEEGQLRIVDDRGKRHQVLSGDLSLVATEDSRPGPGSALPVPP